MLGSSNLVFSTMTAERSSGHKPVHCCLPSGHRQPIFLALAVPRHARLQHTLGGLCLCTCVSARGGGCRLPQLLLSQTALKQRPALPSLALCWGWLHQSSRSSVPLLAELAEGSALGSWQALPNLLCLQPQGADGLCALLYPGCCAVPPGSALLPVWPVDLPCPAAQRVPAPLLSSWLTSCPRRAPCAPMQHPIHTAISLVAGSPRARIRIDVFSDRRAD